MSATVLIVEDNADIRHGVALYLRLAGYDVITAADGIEALKIMEVLGRPGLVLLDLMMPVMDGWALREVMLSDQDLAKIPVLLISGAGDMGQHVATLKVEGYLDKPFSMKAVVDAAKKYCTSAA